MGPFGSRSANRKRNAVHLAIILVIAAIVLWPTAYIATSLVGAVILLATGKVKPQSSRLGLALVMGMMIPVLAQLTSGLWIVPKDPLEHIALKGLVIDRESGDNLLSNSDLSWLQSWRAPAEDGTYALPVEPGFWQLATSRHGGQFNEVRSWQEIPLAAGLFHTLNVVVRHDGSEFGGQIVFRNRDGWQQTETVLLELGPGVVTLSATLQPQEVPTRLRTLHLANLTGDWSQIGVGLATLRPGNQESTQRFSSHNPKVSWQYGIGWLVGTAAILFSTVLIAPYLLYQRYRTSVLLGLHLGLVVQLVVALIQFAVLETSRSTGTLPHPNLLAHGALAAAALIIALSGGSRKHCFAAVVGGGAIIWLSGSDAGILVFVPYCVVVLILKMREFMGLSRILVPTAIVLAAALLAAYVSVGDPLSGSNTVARLQAWQTAVDLAVTYPVAGVGLGNFGYQHEFAVPDTPGPLYRAHHAHSILGIAAELGLGVFIMLIAALGSFLRRALRSGARLAAIGIVSVVALNLMDFTVTNPVVLLPAWILCLSVFWPDKHEVMGQKPVPLARNG